MRLPWRYFTPKGLEEEICRNPFTKDSVDEVLRKCKIEFVELATIYYGKIYPVEGKEPAFIIKINNKKSHGAQEIALLHELLHAYYKVRDYDCVGKIGPRNKLIDKESIRLSQDKSLVGYILEKVGYVL